MTDFLNPFDIYLRQLASIGSGQKFAKSPINSSYNNGGIVDQSVDQQWSDTNSQQGVLQFDNYFDYFFSGQDTIVQISGTEERKDLQLPILQIGFNVQQNKMPLYGFWSYRFDAVARGTRIIQGAMTIATQYPGFMQDVLSQVSTTRLTQEAAIEFSSPVPQTTDDQLIAKYWTDTMDPSVLQANQPNVFAVHPPFDFVIVYGIQNISINDVQTDWASQSFVAEFDKDSNAYFTDTNERLVANNPGQNRLTFINTELTSCQTAFAPDGSLLSETYSFFCQDVQVGNGAVTTNVVPHSTLQ